MIGKITIGMWRDVHIARYLQYVLHICYVIAKWHDVHIARYPLHLLLILLPLGVFNGKVAVDGQLLYFIQCTN